MKDREFLHSACPSLKWATGIDGHPLIAVLAFVSAISLPTPAIARTWYVEKDGSGDFTVIQEAVDAAVSGDTIRIGPGRFDDYMHDYSHPPANYDICVMVVDKDLTITGAGADATVIGFSAYPGTPHDTAGIAGWPINGLMVQDLTVENVLDGISVIAHSFLIERCSFRNTSIQGCTGVVGDNLSGGLIRDCAFESLFQGVEPLDFCPNGIVVENSSFTNCHIGFGAEYSGCRNMLVNGCTFSDCRIGAGIDFGASGEIRNCVFNGQSENAISFEESHEVRAVDNDVDIAGSQYGLGILIIPLSTSSVEVTGNIFQSNMACVYQSGPGDVSFHGNHILPQGDGYAVRTYLFDNEQLHYPEPAHIDLTENYWGTTDVAEIAARILDYHTNPNYEVIVDFEPMADGPVPTQVRTWSDVKAMWGAGIEEGGK